MLIRTMYETDVLIAGAGPTGLTLAIDLARRGIKFRLIEAAAAPSPGSRGKGIQPRTLEILDDLGVIDAVLSSGALYPKFRTHLGRFSLRAGSLGTTKQAAEQTPYPNLWMLSQARAEAILRERLCSLDNRVEFSKALTAYTLSERRVAATLSNGEIIQARFLIGCDGAHSTVRKALGFRLEGETLDDEPSLVADVEIDGLDRRDWHLWPFAKGGVMGLCPLPNTSLFQFMAKAKAVSAGIENTLLKVTGYRVTRVGWNSTYRPSARLVERYRRGPVFLAGDAAHTHPPTGGQGLNTGVQDAYNLAWKLAHVVNGGPDSLLDTYEEERRPIAAAVLGLSTHLYNAPTIKRGEATNQLALNYRLSSLSSGATLGNLHPGDRMPNMRLPDGGNLFTHLRGTHASELVMPTGTRILIRPDGYIAHIGSTHFSEYAGEPVRQIPGVCPIR